MQYQMYWPSWYKLWPSYKKYPDNDYPVIDNVLCIGAFQCRWYTLAHTERTKGHNTKETK